MRLLTIRIDIGAGVSPSRLEACLKGVRVAIDLGQDTELERVRRSVLEQMKFPTDAELRDFASRSGHDNQDVSRLGDLAERYIGLRQEFRFGTPDWWFEYLQHRGRTKKPGKREYLLRETELDRLAESRVYPFSPSFIGLDVLAPALYDGLVSDALRRLSPGPVGVSELRYENPLFGKYFGRGSGKRTISSTADVIEVVALTGPARRMAKADASVAEATVDNRIEASEIEVERQRVALEREKQALLSDQIANARSLDQLNADRIQRSLIEQAMRAGRLDIAEGIGHMDTSEAAALGELRTHPLELDVVETVDEADEGE